MARTTAGNGRKHYSFAFNADTNIQRSVFDMSHTVKTTFNSGFIVPLDVMEVLPGDTINMRLRSLVRLWTPIVPFMDNVYLDVFFFYVPNRLVWEHWEEFCGDDTRGTGTDYLIPVLNNVAAGFVTGDIADMFGLPVGVTNTHGINALPFRCYNKVYNEWFRPEYIIDPVDENIGDGPDDYADYVLLRRAKRLDYFTGALPWPQRGPAVDMPLVGNAPVYGDGSAYQVQLNLTGTPHPGVVVSGHAQNLGLSGATGTPGNPIGFATKAALGATSSGLYADLSDVSAFTINSMRQAFQLQKFYERLARGGSRYTEIIRSFFGVVTGDARLQRPEYLGGNSNRLMVTPVQQTSATTTTPQGNLAAFALSGGAYNGFNHSFVEHGYVLTLINVRADITYQQGVDKLWTRRTFIDFYLPTFAHLGEQPILNKEIFYTGVDINDNLVFGYQERYSEYRYAQSRICGQFRSDAPQSMDKWHLAQDFASVPTLNSTFINEYPPINRVIATQEGVNTPQFFGDFAFEVKATRPIPVYGTPGLVDHF